MPQILLTHVNTALVLAESSSSTPFDWKLPVFKETTDQELAIRSHVCEAQLSQALQKSKLADVQFLLGDAWVASGHWSILCARSQEFARMVEDKTDEAKTGVVKMGNDVTAGGLVVFLEFVYLGTGASTASLAPVLPQKSLDLHP